jgi:hypothetical protein
MIYIYIYIQSVLHRKHVSATEPNRLMMCGETVAVCCEVRTAHTDTLCGQSVPHRKHITSPLQSPTGSCCVEKQLLFAVRTVRNTQIHCVGSPSQETSLLRYRAQPVNSVWGNSRCLLWEPYGTHTYTVWVVRTPQETHHVSTTEPNRLMPCGETVAVCCENRTEHTDTLCG